MERYRMIRKIYVYLLLLLLPVALAGVQASVPKTLAYQATLTDGAGQPVSGDKTIRFSLYTVETGGTAFWTEAQTLTLVGGRLSAVLGGNPSNPLDTTLFTGETWIGIKVGADTEMPRQKFSSVAYAFQAGDGGVPRGGIIMWSGAVDAVPAGWALCDGSNGTPNLRDRFIVGAGGLYGPGGIGGNATINLEHAHIVNGHEHTYSGTTSDIVGRKEDKAGGSGDSIDNHTHTYSGTTSTASGIGTDNRLSSAQSILPPYYALAFIMKL
jgi:hypothetical protein